MQRRLQEAPLELGDGAVIADCSRCLRPPVWIGDRAEDDGLRG
jgi:hypothetical protein